MNVQSSDQSSIGQQPKYEHALVSFVDILGFRNLISTASVDQILDVLAGKERLSLDRQYPKIHDTTTFTFSDLIVNVTLFDSDWPLYIVFEQMRTLGFRQFCLCLGGIFVRGGVTVGDIYIKDRTIFGPALVKAYELENTTAKWPIVAIDPELVQWIKDESPSYLKRREETEGNDGPSLGRAFLHQLAQLIARTDDGVYFLDYIACMAYEDSSTGDLYHYLSEHKKSVMQAYFKHRNLKYEFIAKYHDARCEAYFPGSHEIQVGILGEPERPRNL